MTTTEAINFLQPALSKHQGIWADIGAGNGTFTLALDQILLPGSTIYAVDQDTQTLQNLKLQNCHLEILQADFDQPLTLPKVDGILMANALHYSPTPRATLEILLTHLYPQGDFLLIEYELEQARPPWIPYPITFQKFTRLASKLPLTKPEEKNRVASSYGNNYMYLAHGRKNAE